MRVALVHDYLTQMGGAERVLDALLGMYPNAPIYTLIYDEGATKGMFADRDVRTSFLQKAPFARTQHRLYPPLMPLATEHLDVSGFDLVISSSWSFTKGVLTGPGTVHVSFCHTPLRYAWDDSHRYVDEFDAFPKVLKIFARPALTYLRLWDRAAAQRPDVLVANSKHVKRRIKKYYGREAEIVYPPVRTTFFNDVERQAGDAFLMAGRLMAYKRFDLGIVAAEQAGVPLKIIGDGPEARHLRRLAGKNVTFLGSVDDSQLRKELGATRALLFPQEEDFGIMAVEALAAGVPVIAFRAGGATEIIEEGISGVFFNEQTPDALADALYSFDDALFVKERLYERAQVFDESRFVEGMQRVIEHALKSSFESTNRGSGV